SITLHQLAPTLAGRHPRARPGDPCCGAPFAAGVFAPPSPAEMPDGWSGHGGGGERATSRTCSRGGEVIAAIGPAMLSRMGASSEATPMSDILDYCDGQRIAHFDSGETIIPEGA